MLRKLLLAVVLLLLVVAGAVYFFADRMLASDLVRRQIEQQLATRLGQPVHIKTIAASIFPSVSVHLQDVAIGEPPTVRLGDVQLVTGLRGLLSRTIIDGQVIVSNGRVMLPLPFAPGAGASSSATAASGFTIVSIRTITFRNLDVAAGPQTVHVDLDASVDGDRLAISRLLVRGKTTGIEASGTLTSIARLQGTLDAQARALDLDEVLAIASAFTAAGPQAPSPAPAKAGDVVPIHIVARIAAASGQFASYAFRDLSSTIDLVPGRVVLSPLSVGAFDGTFRGTLEVDSTRRMPRLQLKGRLDGVAVPALLKAGGSAEGMTGTLGGTVALTADGSDAASITNNAHGTMAAVIADGEIQHLDMVRTVVLAFGKPSGASHEGSGSRFSRLGGTFTLANATVSSNDVALASPDFDMSGEVTLRLGSGAISGRAEVALSEELTAQSGTDLRRYAQQDGRVVVPVTVSGTLSKPVAFVDVAAAAKRAFANEVQRRAKDFLGGLFKKKGGG